MDAALDISLNLYLIRSFIVLVVVAGVYFFRYDTLFHLFEVVVHGEKTWRSTDSLVVGGIIFAALFVFAPGMGTGSSQSTLLVFLGF